MEDSPLKLLRKKSDLSQKQLSKMLHLKSAATVSMWETGERYPRTPLIPKIAALLNTTEGEIISAINAAKENAKQPRQKQSPGA